ncbi:hypothetical protein TSAR_016478 [Trichomalopsis sarcophagae]|uniref:Uncharacterized protein n=1 Tax=Trichomalopsis sarcophagae TaxID=543379 RepID=A0A232EKQ5_9HYME|nr:hypothetical protein TSAR_016478 [Trichomalopsis sarcophagae]
MKIGPLVQFIVFVNFHDPKAGLLSSDQLTVTLGFKGNAGLWFSDKPRHFTVKPHAFGAADIARGGARLGLLQTLVESA